MAEVSQLVLTGSLNRKQRRVLALLHLFENIINFSALSRLLVTCGLQAWSADEVDRLLKRAAEIGLLKPVGQVYEIHPALPWFFRFYFKGYYSDREGVIRTNFCTVISELAMSLSKRYNAGEARFIAALDMEEPNLRSALKWGISQKLWEPVTGILHGLEDLMRLDGLFQEWAQLVEHVVTLSAGLDIQTLAWARLREHQLLIARKNHDWNVSEVYARELVEHKRQQAEPYLKNEVRRTELTSPIHDLSVMLDHLGCILTSKNSAESISAFKEALDLAKLIDDRQRAAMVWQNLAVAYREVDEVKNMDLAINSFRNALKFCSPQDNIFRGKLMTLIGDTYFKEIQRKLTTIGTQQELKANSELHHYAELCFAAYHSALNELPSVAVNDRLVPMHNLGVLYSNTNRLQKAESLFQETIALSTQAGDNELAAMTMFDLALIYKRGHRYNDALIYAKAALELPSAKAGNTHKKALDLLAEISEVMSATIQ